MYIGLHVKYTLVCQILMKLECFRHSFEKKHSTIKFNANPVVGACFFHEDGRTDRHDKDNNRFP